MKRIAVTYDNGQVFRHFGRTENFKIYNVEGKDIVSSEVVGSNGAGHEALADVLAEYKIDVLICGGMGAGAQAALSEAGIEICAGATGDADEAVKMLLNGELENSGVNCDHHDHEHEHEEEGGCGSACGSGCGGGCAGCHPRMEGPNVGKTCRVHYRGFLNDGSQFDSSYDRGEPIEFMCGAGMMIQGFDKAVATMEVGAKTTIHLMPDEAYGYSDPEAIFSVGFEELPGSSELEIGERVYLSNAYGQRFTAIVKDKDNKSVTFDANHEMAGKELNFEIELVEVL